MPSCLPCDTVCLSSVMSSVLFLFSFIKLVLFGYPVYLFFLLCLLPFGLSTSDCTVSPYSCIAFSLYVVRKCVRLPNKFKSLPDRKLQLPSDAVIILVQLCDSIHSLRVKLISILRILINASTGRLLENHSTTELSVCLLFVCFPRASRNERLSV